MQILLRDFGFWVIPTYSCNSLLQSEARVSLQLLLLDERSDGNLALHEPLCFLFQSINLIVVDKLPECVRESVDQVGKADGSNQAVRKLHHLLDRTIGVNRARVFFRLGGPVAED